MTTIIPVVCVALLGAFMFATFYGWLGRMTSTLLFVAMSALFLVSVSESIGKPKPLWSEINSVRKAAIVGILPVYNEAIYLWVIRDGTTEPVAYVLPWNTKTAQELQKADREAKANDTYVVMEQPENSTTDPGDQQPGTYVFHAAPQKALPEKNYAQ